ncbi:MAG: hypothetical protein IJS39_02485 [Synergistaceae bacterium]|nr:hypothetical protein [Synergistaceae bacterium]
MAVADGQMGIHVREKHIVLGFDPGRDKTGFAFVDEEGRLIVSGIFPSGESDRFFGAVRAVFGDGGASMSMKSNADTLSEFITEKNSLLTGNISDDPERGNLSDGGASMSMKSNSDTLSEFITEKISPLHENISAYPERGNLSDGGASMSMNSNSDTLSEFIIEKISPLHENISDSIMFIAIGNGTHSKDFTAKVRAAFSCEVLTVDESNTTLEARGLYWKIHAPNFWMRLIPEGLRVPARVLDDLAAWAIALRALKKYRDINQNKL